NKKFAREHPNELRAFTRAYIRGWRDYVESDPRPAHEALKQANKTNTDEFMAFSRKMIIDERLVTGRDKDGGAAKIGRPEPARDHAGAVGNQLLRVDDDGGKGRGENKTADGGQHGAPKEIRVRQRQGEGRDTEDRDPDDRLAADAIANRSADQGPGRDRGEKQ